jgi:hypothetical protein
MNFFISKKIALIVCFVGLAKINENNAMQQLQSNNDNQMKQVRIMMLCAGCSFFGISGIQSIIQGVLTAFSIPISPLENIALSLRNKMSEEDYKKYELGNKIKSTAQIIAGLFLLISSLNFLNELAQARSL